MHLRGFWLGLLSMALLCSCGRENKDTAVSSGPPEKGAIYSLNDGEGGFRAAKVLAIEEDVVFVNLYSERWPKRPSLEEIQKISNPLALAYSMPSFAGMQPVRLQAGSVTPEELEIFGEWKQSRRDTF
jgi:hypothetical protein